MEAQVLKQGLEALVTGESSCSLGQVLSACAAQHMVGPATHPNMCYTHQLSLCRNNVWVPPVWRQVHECSSKLIPTPTSLLHTVLMCTGLAALVEHERSQRLADARAQVAYEAELAQLRLNKLQQYFTSQLAVHHVVLHSMTGHKSISTFRQAELPNEVKVRRVASC